MASGSLPARFARSSLAVLIGLTFSGVILGRETFFYRDFGVFGYPLAQYHRDSFWRGELPLWNPLNNCGLPFLAQWNTLALYPLSIIYLLFPLSWSLGVFNLAHMFLAGLGMYFLARRWTANPFAACVAVAAFAFNGFTWHCLMWPNNIAAIGWMPWVILATERAWTLGGRSIILAALAGAMQMLAGAPEVIFLTWVILGTLWLAGLAGLKVSTAPSPSSAGLKLLRFASVVALVAGLAAAQLIPFLDLLQHSHRDAGFSDSGWAMPVSGLGNFLVPLFHCFKAGLGVFVQYDQYWTSSHYVGVGVIAFMLVALWRARSGSVYFLAAVAIVSVTMALGTSGGLYSVVKTVLPQLGFMRYPIKFVVPAMLALPLLAGFGAAWAETGGDSRRARVTFTTVGAVLLALIALIVLLAWKYPFVRDDWTATWHNALLRAVFVVLILGILARLRSPSAFSNLRVPAQCCLLLALWLDIYTAIPNPNPTIPRIAYTPGMMREDLKLDPVGRVGEPRVMETLSSIDTIRYKNLPDAEADYLCRRAALYDDCNLMDQIPKIDGFFSLYLRETDEVLSALNVNEDKKVDCKGLMDFLGVARITIPGTGLDFTNRTSFLPLVTAGQAPVFADATNTLAGLFQPGFDPRATVFLPPETQTALKSIQRTQANPRSGTLFRATLGIPRQRRRARARGGRAGVLPSLAGVCGRQAHDDLAREFWFPSPRSPGGSPFHLKLAYEDWAFYRGAILSLLTLAACIFAWRRLGKRRNPLCEIDERNPVGSVNTFRHGGIILPHADKPLCMKGLTLG